MLRRGCVSLLRHSIQQLPETSQSQTLPSAASLWAARDTWKPRQAFSSSAACKAASLEDDIIVIPMPQLSPHMAKGRISKWLKKPGEEILTYDVVLEVETESLSEEAYKVGDFAGTVTMLVEAQEDGFLASILLEEGKDVDVDTPIAIMCELESALESISSDSKGVDKLLEEHQKLRRLTWQSYLKEGTDSGGGCS